MMKAFFLGTNNNLLLTLAFNRLHLLKQKWFLFVVLLQRFGYSNQSRMKTFKHLHVNETSFVAHKKINADRNHFTSPFSFSVVKTKGEADVHVNPRTFSETIFSFSFFTLAILYTILHSYAPASLVILN